MSCGCLTCPGGRDGMGVFNRSKLVGLQGTSSVPEGFIGARRVHKREGPERATHTQPHPNTSSDFGHPYRLSKQPPENQGI